MKDSINIDLDFRRQQQSESITYPNNENEVSDVDID